MGAFNNVILFNTWCLIKCGVDGFFGAEAVVLLMQKVWAVYYAPCYYNNLKGPHNRREEDAVGKE